MNQYYYAWPDRKGGLTHIAVGSCYETLCKRWISHNGTWFLLPSQKMELNKITCKTCLKKYNEVVTLQ
jgi:hypothetical protein